MRQVDLPVVLFLSRQDLYDLHGLNFPVKVMLGLDGLCAFAERSIKSLYPWQNHYAF